MSDAPSDPYRTSAPPPPRPTPRYPRCPSCGELALPGTRRCEECRFDFVDDDAQAAWREARSKHRLRALTGFLLVALGMGFGSVVVGLLTGLWGVSRPFGIFSFLLVIGGGRMMLRSIHRLRMLGPTPPKP